MSEVGIIVLLYAVGLVMLVAEIFIPSHGVLTLAGLGLVVWGVVKTFVVGGHTAGVVAVLTCLVLLPALAYLTVSIWPRTPIGRKIAPPNPVASASDSSVPAVELAALVGRRGKTRSSLRPVGVCEFDGRRVSCVSELGLLEAGVDVMATRVVGSNLSVRPVQT